MTYFKNTIYLLILFLSGCTQTKTSVVESEFIKIGVIGNIYEGDWIEVNNYRIEFVLPDTTKARAHNRDYNPYYLKVSKSDNKIGHVSPTNTYEGGPGWPVDKKVTKGMMLYNIGRMLTIMSNTEFDSTIFNFKTDKVAAFNGLLIFGLNDGGQVKITYPEAMNIRVEPYTEKQ